MHKTRCVCIYDACCRLWRATNERQSTRANDPSYANYYISIPVSLPFMSTFPFPLIGTKTSISRRYISPSLRSPSFLILWLLARGCRCIRRRIDIYSESTATSHISDEGKKKKRDIPAWVEAEYKNITAPWEITRVEIPGRAQTVLNARIMKMPIRSPDVLNTRLYCIRRETQLFDSGIFVNIERNQRAVFALRNLRAVYIRSYMRI